MPATTKRGAKPTTLQLEQHAKRLRQIARVVPLVVIGMFTYIAWAIVSEVIIKQLLATHRNSPAIGVTIGFFVLFLITLFCYFRLLILTANNPDYVPKGHGFWKAKSVAAAHAYYSGNAHKLLSFEGSLMRGFTLARLLEFGAAHPDVHKERAAEKMPDNKPTAIDIKNLDAWYDREVFVCNGDGRPAWCELCYNWKPERAHHSTDAGRCVLKLDHYCPWVGGVVSATTAKFFVQFTLYCALACLFALVATIAVMATATTALNPHHFVIVCVCALFGLFTATLGGQVAWLAATGRTNIEYMQGRDSRYSVAYRIPRNLTPKGRNVRTVEWNGRVHVILTLPAGFNPFDLGWRKNVCSLMGDTAFDWLVPLRLSPDLDHPFEWSEDPFRPALFNAMCDAGLDV